MAKELKEKMRMNIEMADNGIIIRNPECEDDVKLATSGANEYKSIGKKVYDWLMDVVMQKHKNELIITNFDIEVVATCKGRER